KAGADADKPAGTGHPGKSQAANFTALLLLIECPSPPSTPAAVAGEAPSVSSATPHHVAAMTGPLPDGGTSIDPPELPQERHEEKKIDAAGLAAIAGGVAVNWAAGLPLPAPGGEQNAAFLPWSASPQAVQSPAAPGASPAPAST